MDMCVQGRGTVGSARVMSHDAIMIRSELHNFDLGYYYGTSKL